MSKQFSLSALGIINSLGNYKEEIFANLILGNPKNVVIRDDLVRGKKLKFGLVNDDLPKIEFPFESYKTRCNQILLAAYLQIENEVRGAIEKYGKDRIAVIIGSSTSGIDEGQKIVDYIAQRKSEPFDYSFVEMGYPAKFLSNYLGLNNISYTISTACSSSAKALLSAQNLLSLGICDAVLVGGSDSLCQLASSGFDAMEALSESFCNPFRTYP